MEKKVNLKKLVGVAVSAATLLALAPLGVAYAADPIDVPTSKLDADQSEQIVVKGGTDNKMKGHKFGAIRIGSYQSAKIDANGDWSNVAVQTVTNPASILPSATNALAATKPAGSNGPEAGYEGNPVGEVTSTGIDENTAPYEDAAGQTLRKFVTNMSEDTDFNTALAASGVTATADPATNTATFKDLPAGVYIIKDLTDLEDASARPNIEGLKKSIAMLVATAITVDSTAYTTLGTSTLGEVNMKNDEPSVTKTLTSGSSVSIGDNLEYKLESAVPLTTSFHHYAFMLTDIPSDGLQYVDGSVKVKIGTNDVDPSKYTVTAPAKSQTNSDTHYLDVDLSAAIMDSTVSSYNDPILVTYKMKVTTNAMPSGVVSNDAVLSTSNDPDNQATDGPYTPNGDDGILKTEQCTPTSPADCKGGITSTPKTHDQQGHEKVYTRTAKFVSEAKADQHTLVGTQFRIYRGAGHAADGQDAIKFDKTADDGVYTMNDGINNDNLVAPDPAVVTVAADGTLTLKGLGDGDYTVEEVTTGTGYESSPKSKFNLHIEGTLGVDGTKFTNEKDTWDLVEAHDTLADFTDPIVVFDVATLNQLPITGGAGVILGSVVAVLLLGAAGGMYIFKRRQDGAAVAGAAKIIR